MSAKRQRREKQGPVRRKRADEDGDVLDAHAAAQFLGAHVESIRRLARKGDIPAYKIGKDWRFHKDALLHWIETHHLRSQEPTILMIDDDARVRNTLRRILENHRYIVSEAKDGEGALGLLRKTPPDIVLLDLKLPGMGGPAVLKEIREKYGLLPVIIITAYPDSELMDRALKYPPLIMLPKPVGVKELLDSVRLALGVRRSPETGQKKVKGKE